MIMYCCKFNKNVKNELICDKCVINNLNKFTRIVIEINNKLYKKIIKKKYNKNN